MLKKVLTILTIILLIPVIKAEATEGIIELSSLDGSNARCFAMSTVLNRSTNYQVMIQCKNLIYPLENNSEYYILWATNNDEKRTTRRIGDIGLGKITFTTRPEFLNLFITKEQNSFPKEPSTQKIMQGNIKPITFLESPPTPTPTLNPAQIKPTNQSSPILSITPTPAPKTNTAGLVIKTITIILAIVVIIIIIVIAIYTIYKLLKPKS